MLQHRATPLLPFQPCAGRHRCPALPPSENTFCPSEMHAPHTAIPGRAAQPQLKGLLALKLGWFPGRHAASSKGHRLWLLFRLLSPLSAFRQSLESSILPRAEFFLAQEGMRGHRNYPWPAVPCGFGVSPSGEVSSERWRGAFLEAAEKFPNDD